MSAFKYNVHTIQTTCGCSVCPLLERNFAKRATLNEGSINAQVYPNQRLLQQTNKQNMNISMTNIVLE